MEVEWPRRVVWHSVVPWAPSAYGAQTRLMAKLLREQGVEVLITAASGMEGGTVSWEGFEVHAVPSGVHGALGGFVRKNLNLDGGDRLITLVDAWRLRGQDLIGIPTLAWTNFETEPASRRGLEALRTEAARPIPSSQFVADLLIAAGLEGGHPIPHGIDRTVFSPLRGMDRSMSRDLARNALGLPRDSFIVGMVVSNAQGSLNRKSVPEVALAIAPIARRDPRVLLYIHTNDLYGSVAQGLDLPLLMAQAGVPADQVVLSSAHDPLKPVDDRAMSVRYNALDVLCQPSAGEGFCIPLVEAQSCGVPVIASQFSAQPEQVGPGWVVGGQRRWIPEMDATVVTPSVQEIGDAIEMARQAGPGVFLEAVRFSERYDARVLLADQWKEALGSESWPTSQ